MYTVTLSSQRQITVPKGLLDMIGFGKGGKLFLYVKNDNIVAIPVRASIVKSLAGSLEKLIPDDKKAASLNTIDRLTRKAVAAKIANE